MLLYQQQPSHRRQGSSGTRHSCGAGRGASGYGGQSTQKAELCSPCTIRGEELPGLGSLWMCCGDARSGRAQALIRRPAAVLGMVPDGVREPGIAVIS